MKRSPVLLVEDTPSIAMLLSGFLRRSEYEVITASSALEAQARFSLHRPAVVLLDLRLPDGDGIALLKEFKALNAETKYIIITSDASPQRALEATQAGAFDYLLKPVSESDLINAVARAYSRNGGAKLAGRRFNVQEVVDSLSGSSAAIRETNAAIRAAAKSRAPVLLSGESGVGKGRCATAIHMASNANSGVFYSANCADLRPDSSMSNLPDLSQAGLTDLFEPGDSLFLENICELNPEIQSWLLRAFEPQTEFHARIICSTSKDAWAAVKSGKLREDLYHRLNVVGIQVPALRQRGDDVLIIANRVIPVLSAQEHRTFIGMTAAAEKLVRDYDWPGNIRQLVNTLWGAIVLNDGDRIAPEMLPAQLSGPVADTPQVTPVTDAASTLAEIERDAILRAIAANDGSVPKAAAQLAVSPSTLYRKLEIWNKGGGTSVR